MQNSIKRHFFFPIAFPVTYSRTIVAFNCIYQLPEAVGSGINSLECIFKLVKFTVLTTSIKISNFMHSFHFFRLSIILKKLHGMEFYMWKFDGLWEIITLDLMRVDIGGNSQNSLQEYLKSNWVRHGSSTTFETGLRPSSDVVLLPCRTKFKN